MICLAFASTTKTVPESLLGSVAAGALEVNLGDGLAVGDNGDGVADLDDADQDCLAALIRVGSRIDDQGMGLDSPHQ